MALTPNEIDQYCEAHSHPTSDILQALYKATHARTEFPIMLVGPLEASLLRMLVKMNAVKRILEIGTFTGYSALAMAEALPDDGEIITLDVNEATTNIAKEFWAQSPHGKKISLKLGPALESLNDIEGQFDMVFVDADKHNYPHYWEACVPRLKPGGFMALDNAFLGGRVLNPESEAAMAMDKVNKMALEDPRVESCLLSVRDGLMLARRI